MPSTFDAFRHKSFRLLWPANFFSYISRWMQMTLLSWLVLELTDSPFFVALVGFFGMAPLLLFGAIGGVLADRLNKRNLMLTSQTINLLASVGMIALLLSGRAEFWHAYVLVFITGLGWAFDMPSRRSILPDLVGQTGLTNAMALDSVGMHSSRMLGPTIAGALIALVGVTGGFFVVAGCMVVAIGFMAVVNMPPRRTLVAASANIFKNMAEGFSYVRGNRVILATVIITVFMNLLLFPYMQMVPVISKHTLGVGPELMGLLMGADGFGAIIGSMTIASVGGMKYHGRVYLYGSLAGLIMCFAFAVSQNFAASLVMLILLGLGTAGFGTMQATIIVLSAKEEMRGRALGVISLAIGAGPIGALIIGAIADITSPATAIMILTTIGFVTVGLVGIAMPQLRGQIVKSEPEPPDTARVAVQNAD
ncbi:MAG: MFS transporter [SAR202 cluster bacterium]|nr:MFS transporter [SAR202 cluster bacterium]MDP6512562.1 MFS transporter [SAR202 cluster bacterium]MDP6714697.1 MFS transporter [SAR202 cluster bacterium]